MGTTKSRVLKRTLISMRCTRCGASGSDEQRPCIQVDEAGRAVVAPRHHFAGSRVRLLDAARSLLSLARDDNERG